MSNHVTVVIKYEDGVEPEFKARMTIQELAEEIPDGVVSGVAFYDLLAEEDEE